MEILGPQKQQGFRPIAKGLMAGVMTCGLAMMAIRRLGEQTAAYRAGAVASGLVVGGAVYRINAPKIDAEPLQPLPCAMATTPVVHTAAKAAEPIQPVDRRSDLQKAHHTLQAAIQSKASPWKIRALLKEAIASAVETPRPGDGEIYDLLYDHRAFAESLVSNSHPLQGKWQEILAQGEEQEVIIRRLAGQLMADPRALQHPGTLKIEGHYLDQLGELFSDKTFAASGLILTYSESTPHLLSMLESIHAKFPHLKWLQVEGVASLEFDTVKLSETQLSLLNKTSFPALQSLRVKGDATLITPFFYALPKLEKLQAFGDVTSLPFIHLPSLKELYLDADAPRETIAACCPFVQRGIDLTSARAAVTQLSAPLMTLHKWTAEETGKLIDSYPSLTSLPSSGQRHQQLTLNTGNLEVVVRALRQLPHLRKITFTNRTISSDVVYELATFPHITALEFPNGATKGQLSYLLSDPHLLAQVCHLPPFRDDVQSFYRGPMTGSVMFQVRALQQGIARNIFNPEQRVLDPVSCAMWLKNDHFNMIQECPPITTLLLDDQVDLTDDQLVAFIGKFPEVTRISLQRCPNITSAGIQGVLRTFPHLHGLNLTGCTQLDTFALFDPLTQREFPLHHDLELVLDDTPISKEAIAGSKRPTGQGRINLLEGRLPAEMRGKTYGEVLEWYQKRPPIDDPAVRAVDAYFHTGQFPANTTIDTLLKVFEAKKEDMPIAAIQIEQILCHRISGGQFDQLLDFAGQHKLPALHSALLTYAVTMKLDWQIFQRGRFDPAADPFADFTVSPCLPGEGEDIPCGAPLTFSRLILQEGKELHQEFQPGYRLHAQNEFSWSDIAFGNDQALQYLHDLLYIGQSKIPLDLDLANAVYGLGKRGGFQRVMDRMSAWATQYEPATDEQNHRKLIIMQQL